MEDQTVIPGAVPPIISVERFDRVNDLMESRRQRPGRMKAKVVYLLGERIHCGKCGSLYRGESYVNSKSSSGNRLKFYKCGHRCGNANVRKSDIEQVVINHLVDSVFSDDFVDQLAEKAFELFESERDRGADEK